MSDMLVSDRQKRLEGLAHAVLKWGEDAVEVSLWSNELTIERRLDDARNMCTVILLQDEPTFQARFEFRHTALREISFNIGADDDRPLGPAAVMRFNDNDDAARWLLEYLEAARAAGHC